jgi:hypothetical protein
MKIYVLIAKGYYDEPDKLVRAFTDEGEATEVLRALEEIQSRIPEEYRHRQTQFARPTVEERKVCTDLNAKHLADWKVQMRDWREMQRQYAPPCDQGYRLESVPCDVSTW